MHNADIIQNLDLHLNDTVFVEKGGEIIPKITGVDIQKRDPAAQPVTFIEHCPECGAGLIRNEGEAAHYCPNEDNCPPQIKGKIEHFVSRKAMDIDGLGQETIDLLFNRGLVKSVADLYRLKKEQLAGLERMGEKSAQRILEGLEASKKVPFERALYALGIRFVGETVAKKLAKEVISIQNLIEMTKEDLIKIDEIGDRIADSVVDYFSNDEHLKIIDFLEKQGVQFHLSEEQLTNRTEKLAGLNIVISGTFQKFSRDELKKLIEQNGGKNTGSISKNTSYVLAGENMGPSKLERANSLGVPVISEDDFLKMIQD